MKKKIIIVFSFLIMCMGILPQVIFASGWVETKIGDSIAYVMQLIFKPVFDTMIDALSGILITPDLSTIAYLQTAMHYSQYIALSLLTTQLAFQVWSSMTSRAFRGQSVPMPDILWRTFLSAVLIFGLPEILNYLITLNAALIDLIASLGIDFTSGLKMLAYPLAGSLVTAIFFCIWIIALVGLTISNAIRLGELCFLYILGPILATSYAGKGESFQIWVMQAVSVTFTQAVQFLMVGASLQFTANIGADSWTSMLLPIGSVVVAIRGPQMLKQFLYSTGVGGAVTGGMKSVASTAIYSKMMSMKG